MFLNWVSFRFCKFWWVSAEFEILDGIYVLGFLELLKIIVGFDGEFWIQKLHWGPHKISKLNP